jgi:hypothetical protein
LVQEDDDEGKGSDEDAAVDVLFNDDGSRNVPCRRAAPASSAPTCVLSLADASLCRDGDELARERERKMKLLEKQMGAVLKTVPTVPPKPRRGDFNSAM